MTWTPVIQPLHGGNSISPCPHITSPLSYSPPALTSCVANDKRQSLVELGCRARKRRPANHGEPHSGAKQGMPERHRSAFRTRTASTRSSFLYGCTPLPHQMIYHFLTHIPGPGNNYAIHYGAHGRGSRVVVIVFTVVAPRHQQKGAHGVSRKQP